MELSTISQKKMTGSVVLMGEIDERTDFALLNVQGTEITVHCGGVTRVNSCGVRAWRKFFRNLRAKGVKLRFENLSAPLIDCVNMFSDFIRLEEVESFQAHVFCACCRKAQAILYKISYGAEGLERLEQIACARCGGKLALDENPRHYLRFFEVVRSFKSAA
ncbi:MAG: STAS domain-containing protein [Oligoflexia bacterium]|nr:STAS domain-containing protein [Oligoflexia bacterium]